MRTVIALWRRQIIRYLRSRSRMIGSLAQPVLYLAAFGLGFGPMYQRAGGGNFIQFLAPGVILMAVLFTAMFNGIEVIWDRQFGFLKETLVAPVPRLYVMAGRTLGGATVATFQGLLVLLVCLIAGFRPVSALGLVEGIGFLFMVALFFTALGTGLASGLQDMQGFQLILNFLIMPIFFLSGALFPVADLSGTMQVVVRLDPLFYGVDGLRGVFGGLAAYPASLDALVLILLTAAALWFGAWRFSKMEA
jgi:ABC-2 type transport system permease protein